MSSIAAHGSKTRRVASHSWRREKAHCTPATAAHNTNYCGAKQRGTLYLPQVSEHHRVKLRRPLLPPVRRSCIWALIGWLPLAGINAPASPAGSLLPLLVPARVADGKTVNQLG